MSHLIRPNHESQTVIDVTSRSAEWGYLSFQVIALKPGEGFSLSTASNEIAVVPLAGKATFKADGEQFEVSREGVFDELPHILYLPPGDVVSVRAISDFEFAIGGAPAEGKYPPGFSSRMK